MHPHLPGPLVLGVLTIVSGAATVLGLLARQPVTALVAVVFVVAAFVWNLTRGENPAHAFRNAPPPPACAGCAAGCVGCRERLDVG